MNQKAKSVISNIVFCCCQLKVKQEFVVVVFFSGVENSAALGCVSMSSCSQQQTRVMSVFWSYSEREEHVHISEVSDCSCVSCAWC